MMQRTHLAIVLFFILVFVPYTSHKITFCIFAFLASLIPDVDSEFSSLGKYRIMRVLQFFTKHRGLLHSLSFCMAISFILALFLPILAFPVFLGYAMHLLADSITIEGVQPFWPLKRRAEGFIRTNSSLEHAIFLSFVLVNFLIILSMALKVL
jgi:inner membrane protein